MKSVMTHNFSQIPPVKIQRSTFNRSHAYKTTFNSGFLVPFFVDEALPGDTFSLRHTILARLNTPIVPIMDNMFLETFYFFVPNRLLWSNWEKFNGEQDNPDDSTDFLIPTISPQSVNSGKFLVGSLADYFGCPINVDLGIATNPDRVKISSFPFRAYNLIWNEWFRDENLQDSVFISKDDISRSDAFHPLLRRGKRHDYFTSALPWPQKGDGVTIDMDAGDAPIYSNGLAMTIKTIPAGAGFTYTGLGADYNSVSTDPNRLAFYTDFLNIAQGSGYGMQPPPDALRNRVSVNIPEKGDPESSNIYADLSGSSITTTINALRTGFQLQKMLERDARGGTRYTEIIRSHFGVISPDARLQRPEYLGGSSRRIMINPVQQTSSTDATSPQGNLAAFGQVMDQSNGFNKTFTEHGVILGLVNVRADITYQQGLPRMFQRQTRYDFYWPSLAHLGEQAILNSEIYTSAYNAVDSVTGDILNDKVFGYQERYAEYRYYPSKITGKLRSGITGSLDIWHLSQKFTDVPVLGETFIQDIPPVSRIIATPAEPEFTLDVFFDMRCARPMPVYSVPGLIDHF